jgi:hypothetical protein
LFLKAKNGRFKKIFKMKKDFINNDMLDSLQYTLMGNLETQFTPQKYKATYVPQLKVFFNDKKKATTLIEGDNVVVVKTKKGEKYNRRIGFLEAYFELKSGMSKTQKNKYLDEVIKEGK